MKYVVNCIYATNYGEKLVNYFISIKNLFKDIQLYWKRKKYGMIEVMGKREEGQCVFKKRL